MVNLSPEMLLQAYANGAFPMADREGRISWYTADPRGIIPLETFRISRSLRQVIAKHIYEIRVNCDFAGTMRQCMLDRPEGSWINQELIAAYVRLHELGYAHSVEAWHEGRMVGGLYGVSLGAAFFGESMFYRMPNASKVCLHFLVMRLRERGFELLDAQATTAHLSKFGCKSIPADEYLLLLRKAIVKPCQFD